MSRTLLSLLAAAAFAATAYAHMVYIVPVTSGQSIIVVFSDTLDPDEKVKMDKLGGLKLFARIDGKDIAVDYHRGDHSFSATLRQTPTVIYGTVVYGMLSRADKPTLLVYHPKAVLASGDMNATTIGDAAVLEIVPITKSGTTRFGLLAKGKPVANAGGSVLLPDGQKQKVQTDAEGCTPSFTHAGRYAVYLRLTETKSGVHDGRKYEEIRHYATLVVNVAK